MSSFVLQLTETISLKMNEHIIPGHYEYDLLLEGTTTVLNPVTRKVIPVRIAAMGNQYNLREKDNSFDCDTIAVYPDDHEHAGYRVGNPNAGELYIQVDYNLDTVLQKVVDENLQKIQEFVKASYRKILRERLEKLAEELDVIIVDKDPE